MTTLTTVHRNSLQKTNFLRIFGYYKYTRVSHADGEYFYEISPSWLKVIPIRRLWRKFGEICHRINSSSDGQENELFICHNPHDIINSTIPKYENKLEYGTVKIVPEILGCKIGTSNHQKNNAKIRIPTNYCSAEWVFNSAYFWLNIPFPLHHCHTTKTANFQESISRWLSGSQTTPQERSFLLFEQHGHPEELLEGKCTRL